MSGESRGMQFFYAFLCITIAANLVHATSIFPGTSTYSQPIDTESMTVELKNSGDTGLGDILNVVSYMGGGAIGLIVSLLLGMAFPGYIIADMLGMSLIAIGIGVVFECLYLFFMFIGGAEILTGRVILQ
jgi:hypothetical protein